MKKTGILLVLFCLASGVFASVVDSVSIPSKAMQKTYQAAVVLPDSYKGNNRAYPVLYLLHGGGGHFRDWLTLTPDKQLVKKLADQYNLIIVMPEGETFSWYLNSPLDKNSQFESYITEDVIQKIDNSYRTIRSGKGRVITGLSMGGHGALYLSARHPDLFCAAGSMSGAVDMKTENWRITPEFLSNVNSRFEKLLGRDTSSTNYYFQNSVVNLADKMKQNGLPLIIECGVDDFLIEPNRELHRRLVYNKTPHDYTERPGAHTWPYWENALPYHVAFFHRILLSLGSAVS
ncbi:alpha/beta hydrolase [Sediminibacterium soli]|uniref:alpha/beta hydrolase n=1 Tax=Sediminibacterium soli TaxID=2698829 RepID=UPI00137B2A76|nr:alpha/beta hydrolase family protein [Sediminibacterium soli]NCI48239.1 esterase family protein [Sediminibacterium soli]